MRTTGTRTLGKTVGKTIAAALAAVTATAVLSACGAAAEKTAGGLTKITYAAFDGPSGLPAKFGIQKGFFRQAGLEVAVVKATDPVGLVTSGDADVADADTTSSVLGAGKGAPVRIISSMFRTKGPFYLVGSPTVKSVQDLKGKKVGIGRKGSGMEVYTRFILKRFGLTEKDVTLVANGSYQPAYASLQSKQVDATIIHEPFVSLAESQKVGKLLAKGWDYLPTFHTGVEISNTQFIQSNPDVVKKFLTAYFKSASYAKAHQKEFRDFAITKIKVPAAVEDSALARELPIWENKPAVDPKALADTQRIQRELGFQDTSYDTTDIVDTSHVPTPAEFSQPGGAK